MKKNIRKIFLNSFLILCVSAGVAFTHSFVINSNFKLQTFKTHRTNLNFVMNTITLSDDVRSFFNKLEVFTAKKKMITKKKREKKAIISKSLKVIPKNIKLKQEKIISKLQVKKVKKLKVKIKDALEIAIYKEDFIPAFNSENLVPNLDLMAIYENIKIKEEKDRISTALAATEKSITENKINENIKKEEEPKEPLPLNDVSLNSVYENEPEVIETPLEIPKYVSSQKQDLETVKSKTQKENLDLTVEKKVLTSLNTPKMANKKKDSKALEPEFIDLSKENPPVVVAENKVDTKKEENLEVYNFTKQNDYSFCSAPTAKKVFDTSLTLSPKLINFNGSSKLEGYELKFLDSDYESISSDQDNKIILQTKLNGPMSIRRGTILSRVGMPTTSEFTFEFEPIEIKIPVLARDTFNEILRNENIRGNGAHLLIELDDFTESATLLSETKYEKKLHLNKNFKVVNPGSSEYSYILYIGVDAGNTILTYHDWKGKSTSKIIHLTNDEIFYDYNLYIESDAEKIEICEESLLSKNLAQVYINGSDLESFSSKTKIKNLGINTVEINNALYPLGTRRYFSLKQQDDEIFFGKMENTKIVVPDMGYKKLVYESFGLRDLGNQCVVQINLTKPVIKMSYTGESYQGYMNVEKLLLDESGRFFNEFSETTQKIFFLGELQGIINVKLSYADGSFDFLQTFCSEGTYLVEQL